MFQNHAEYRDPHPGEALAAVAYCAPRVTEGFALQAAWNRLAVCGLKALRRDRCYRSVKSRRSVKAAVAP